MQFENLREHLGVVPDVSREHHVRRASATLDPLAGRLRKFVAVEREKDGLLHEVRILSDGRLKARGHFKSKYPTT
jgi:hypothetical protein